MTPKVVSSKSHLAEPVVDGDDQKSQAKIRLWTNNFEMFASKELARQKETGNFLQFSEEI